MAHIYRNIEALIGGTPLLEMTHLEEKYGLEAKILAKVEFLNPGGSAKDRVAKKMVEDAEARGLLKPGATLIEPTSGNTGIGLAVMAAARGYRAIIVMPDSMSVERQLLMSAFGAELVLTEGAKGMAGAIEKAEELAREIPNAFIPGQFDNPANPQAHYETTGPEIYADTDGAVDIFVAGIGTGGNHYRRRTLSAGKKSPGTSDWGRTGGISVTDAGQSGQSWPAGHWCEFCAIYFGHRVIQ